MKKLLFAFILLLTAAFWSGKTTAQEVVSPQVIKKPAYYDLSVPLRDIPPDKVLNERIGEKRNRVYIPGVKEKPYPYKATALPKGPDAVWQKEHPSSKAAMNVLQNFAGQTNGSYPPDCNGAAGPNHYFQTVNCTYAIYSKTGALLAGPNNMNTLFTGVTGATENDGDPIIIYDEFADRWLASEFSLKSDEGGNDYMLIAVSQTNDPTGSWYRYSFDVDDMPDYMKFGIWRDGYYMAVNNSDAGANDIYVFDRATMLTGGAATMIGFDNPNRPNSGFHCIEPLDNDFTLAPAGTPGQFITINDDGWGGSDQIWIYALNANWTTPANSTFARTQTIAVNAFDSDFGSSWDNISQPGSQKLDAVNQILMYRAQYINFGSYQSIVCCHTVDVDNTDHAGIRWYELRNTGSGWSIRQQGTYAPDAHSRWMGSISMNINGEIGLGYSISSTTLYPGIRIVGQSASANSAASGVMDIPEYNVQSSSYSQGSYNRWGDYAQMSVDPADQTTFWFTTEYLLSISNKGTKIVAFKIPDNNDPTNFAATATSTTQIDLSWTLNESRNVLLAWSADGTFGTPSGSYTAGQTISGGGQVLYKGNATSFNHTSLTASTMYYYKIWTLIDGTPTYSEGSAVSARTFCSIEALPYTENFETGVGCWDLSGIFEVGIPANTTDASAATAAHGGSNTLVTDANANYPDNIALNAQTAISPTLDCSGYADVQLKFYSWSRFEGSTYDWGAVSYSIDGGTTWTQTGVDFKEKQTAWTLMTYDLPNAAGQSNVKIKFTYKSDISGTFDGWNIDDLTVTGTQITNDPEPTNYPTAFAVNGTPAATSITLTWTDAVGTQLPDNYLIVASEGTITAPVDGTPVADGNLVKNVAQGTRTVTFSGLTSETTYNFAIFPYTNSGTNINYKNSAGYPTAQATTDAIYLIEIGAGTGTTYYVPLYGNYDYNWSATIYEQSTINQAITINTIAYYVANAPINYQTLTQKVYMTVVPQTNFTGNTAKPDPAGMTLVFDGNLTWNGTGWHEITLTTPFDFNNTGNLLIYWENRDGSYVSGYPTFRYTTVTDAAKYKYADGTFPTAAGSVVSTRPNLKISYSPLAQDLPSVSTANAETVTDVAAILGGEILDGGTSAITATGVVYSTTANPEIGGAGVTNAPTNPADLEGVFTVSVSGLTASTTYYYKAYATNGSGTAYGTEKQFTTAAPVLPEPTNYPTAFAVSGTPTSSSVTLTWTDAIGAQLPANYLVVASEGAITVPVDGTPVADGSLAKNVAQGTQTVTFSGLTSETTYNFAIFPYTNTGVLSNYKNSAGYPTAQATTDILVCTPCASSGNTAFGTSITLVNFGTINNATDKTVGYTDYTAISTDVVLNSIHDLTVNLNTDGNYTIHSIVWIDWNHNCDFTDAGEMYDMGTAINTDDGATNLSPLSVTVPANAKLGSTIMRVSCKYNADPTACMTNQDGEVEDYTINVLPDYTLVSTFPFTENFRKTLGLFEQSTTDGFDFVNKYGATPSNVTGPEAGYDDSWYLWAQSQGHNGQTAEFFSPVFNVNSLNAPVLAFAYHMQGYSTYASVLTVETSIDLGTTWQQLWTKTGSQGAEWKTAGFDLTSFKGELVIFKFKATMANNNYSDIAIDRIQILDAIIDCAATVSSFPYAEPFETLPIGWFYDPTSTLNFKLRTGATATGGTGPDAAYQGSKYIYADASFNDGKNATLVSPCFNTGSLKRPQLTFMYHMYSENYPSNMGTLTVDVTTNGGISWNEVAVVSGNQGNMWQQALVDLTPYKSIKTKIRIKAQLATGFEGDIAIDYLRIGEPYELCDQTASLPYNTSFESGLEGFVQYLSDDFNWTRHSGDTPSGNTGPAAAYQGTYYLYTEASGNENSIAMLESPCVNLSLTANPTLEFYFNMYCGDNTDRMGSMKVEVMNRYSSYGWITIWEKTGRQTGAWELASVALPNDLLKFRIVGTTGGYSSDMAIDMLSIGDLTKDALATENANFENGISIYPNPSNGVVNISTYNLDANSMNVVVCDITGKIVANAQFTNLEHNTIDLSNQPKGVYFVKMQLNNTVVTRKVVLK